MNHKGEKLDTCWAIPVQESVLWFLCLHNAALVQEVEGQNNLCCVESCEVLIESLKPRQQRMNRKGEKLGTC
jgi:hypothetical protein